MEHLHTGTLPGMALVIGLCMVGVTQLRSSLALYGAQSVMLGLLAIAAGREHAEPLLVIFGCVIMLAKGAGVPLYLWRTATRIGCRVETGLIAAPPLQIYFALAGLVLLVVAHPFGSDFAPATLTAFGVILLGMQQMLTRRLAISQIIGFLVLENGIFMFTVLQPRTMPIVVELGVLMDVLAGTMLAGLLSFRISRSFEHIDTSLMTELRG